MINSKKRKILITVFSVVLILATILMFSSLFQAEGINAAAITPTYSTLGTHNMYSPVTNYFDYTGDKHSSNKSSGDELVFYRKGGVLIGAYTGKFVGTFELADNLFSASKNGYLTVQASATIWSNKTASTYDDVSMSLKSNGKNLDSTGTKKFESKAVTTLTSSEKLSSKTLEMEFTASPKGGLGTFSEADSHFKQPQIILSSTDKTAPETIKFVSAAASGDNVNIVIEVNDLQSGVMNVVLDGYTASSKDISSDTKNVKYTFSVPQSVIRNNNGKITVDVTDNVGNSRSETIQAFSSNPTLTLGGTQFGGWFVDSSLNATINSSFSLNNNKYYYTTDGSEPTKSSSLFNGTVNVPDGQDVVVKIAGVDDFGFKTSSYEVKVNVDTKDYEITVSPNFDDSINIFSSLTKKRNQPFEIIFSMKGSFSVDRYKTTGLSFDGEKYSIKFEESEVEADYNFILELFKQISSVFVPTNSSDTYGSILKIDEELFSTSNIPNGIDGFDEAYYLRKNDSTGDFEKFEGYETYDILPVRRVFNNTQTPARKYGIYDILPAGEYKLYLRYCDDEFLSEPIIRLKQDVSFALNSYSGTYNGTKFDVSMSASCLNLELLNFSYEITKDDKTVNEIKDAGTYKFTASFDTANFNPTTETEFEFTVYTQDVSFALNSYKGTYKNNAFDIVMNANCANYEVLNFSFEITKNGEVVNEIKNAGTYKFTASFDTANFNPKTETEFNFVVEKSDLVISANDFVTIYGDFEVPKISYTIVSGLFDNIDEVISGSLYVADSYDEIVTGKLNAGTYTVKTDKLELINSNYTLKVSNANYVVEKRDLSINFGNKDYVSEYGANDVDFVCPTVSNSAYGEIFDFQTNNKLIARESGIYSGSYKIFVKDFANKYTNYNAVYSNNTYTVVKREVIIMVDENQGKEYGSLDSDIKFDVFFGSILEGDVLSLERAVGENVGKYQYSVVPNSNYSVIIGNPNVKYEIFPREIEVAPASLEYTYGDSIDYEIISKNGLVAGDSLSGNIVLESYNAGERRVLVGTLNNPNYTIVLGEYYCNILPKVITITANGGSCVYGEDTNNFGGYTVSGLVGNDTVKVSLTIDEIIMFTDIEIKLGEVLINGISDFSNYEVEFVGNVFNFVKSEIDIIVSNGQKVVYGDEIELEYSTSSALAYGDKLAVKFTSDNLNFGIRNVSIAELSVYRNGVDVSEFYNFTVSGEFEIIKREVEVVLESDSKQFGDSDDLAYSVSGLLEGDFVRGELVRTEGENVGSYEICFGALSVFTNDELNENYIIKFNGSYTIVKRTVEINVSGSKVYDGTTEISDQINVDSIDNVIDGWNLVGEFDVQSAKNVGRYPIGLGSVQFNGIDLSNFEITVSGYFEIMPKTLTITYTGSMSKVFGDEDPQFNQFTVDGLCDEDSQEDVIEGFLSRISGENVGKYKVVIGDMIIGSNYEAFVTDCDFEITQRILSVNVGKRFSSKFGEPLAVISEDDYRVSNVFDGYILPQNLVVAPNVTAVGVYKLQINSEFANNANFKYEITGNSNYEIIKNDLKISQNVEKIYYDGFEHEISISINNATGIKVDVIYPNGVPVNAGEHEVVVMFGGNENFNEFEQSFTLVISKAPIGIFVYKESFTKGELYLAEVLNDPNLCKTIYTVAKEGITTIVEFELGDYPSEPGSYKYTITVDDENYTGRYDGVITILPVNQFTDGANSVEINSSVSRDINIKIQEQKNSDILSGYLNSIGKFLSESENNFPQNLIENKYVYSRVWVVATDSDNQIVTLSGKVNINKYYVDDWASEDTLYKVVAMSNKDGRTLEEVNAELLSEEVDGKVRYYFSLSSIDADKQYIILAESPEVKDKTIYYIGGTAVLGLGSFFLNRRRRFKASRVFNNRFFNKSKMNKLSKKNNFSKVKPLKGLK